MSEDCNAANPTDITSLNYPDMHLILVVNGEETGLTELIFADGFDTAGSALSIKSINSNP